jgi:hypothetical protein
MKQAGMTNAACLPKEQRILDGEVSMKTREIPREEWVKFFNNMSRRQEGWQVGLEVFSPEIGDQVEERNMFLAGLAAEVTNDGANIEIMLGGKATSHVTHVVKAPVLVELQQTDFGEDAALKIQSADGTTSLLHLC